MEVTSSLFPCSPRFPGGVACHTLPVLCGRLQGKEKEGSWVGGIPLEGGGRQRHLGVHLTHKDDRMKSRIAQPSALPLLVTVAFSLLGQHRACRYTRSCLAAAQPSQIWASCLVIRNYSVRAPRL